MKQIEFKCEEIAEHLWTNEERSAHAQVSLELNLLQTNEAQILLCPLHMTPRAVCIASFQIQEG